MTTHSPKEFRFRRIAYILDYIKAFSETEKVIFGIVVLLALVSCILMLGRINEHFLTEIPTRGGNIREGMIGLPRTINPVLAITDTDRDLSALVYSGLMKYKDGQLVGDLADSYTVSDDGLTYTFTLKNNLYFQDDSRLTADDVVFTIQKIQDPSLKSPRSMDWANITVKALSANSVQFILKQPYSPFLSNTTIGIIPKHIWGSVTDDQFIFSQYNTQPVGTGPYKVDTITRDTGGIPTSYTLSTWKGYYDAIPYISTITPVFINDESKAVSAIDAGTIDSLASISPTEAALFASDKAQNYTVISTPLPRIFGVFFNQNQNPLLADSIVRQALDMSVDRSAIVHTILDGYGVPIQGPLPTDMSTLADTNDHPNIAGAQALLEKNGWKKNSDGIYAKTSKDKKSVQTISFDLYTGDTPDLKQAAEMVKSSWANLGVAVTIKIFEPSDLYQNVIRPRKYDALLFGESIGKDRDLYAFWHSSERNSPGLNVSMYTNTKADALLENIRTTSDDRIKATKYAQFEQIIRTDIPAVFLYAPDFIYVVPKSIHHMELGSITTPTDRWSSISEWYIETQKVWNIFAHNQ